MKPGQSGRHMVSGDVRGERKSSPRHSPAVSDAGGMECFGGGGRHRRANGLARQRPASAPRASGSRSARTAPPRSSPPPSPYIAWDDRLTGFGVRVLPTGTKSYILNYRPGGGRGAPNRRMVLGHCENTTAGEARHVAEDTLARIAAGADPAAERAHARALRARAHPGARPWRRI